MDTIEAMESCTAIRYFEDKPVAREILTRLVYAATRASSPANSQSWEFVVIDDVDQKRAIGSAVSAGMAPAFAAKPSDIDGVQGRMYQGAEHLANNFAQVPAWILGCGRKVYPPQAPSDMFLYSSLYPAAQNLIVAARALNIGTCFTTFQMVAESAIRETCKIPADLHLCVFIAVGHPARPFKPVKRKPVESVLHWNSF